MNKFSCILYKLRKILKQLQSVKISAKYTFHKSECYFQILFCAIIFRIRKTKSFSRIGDFFTRCLPIELTLKTMLARISERGNFCQRAKLAKMDKIAKMARMTKWPKKMPTKVPKIDKFAETEKLIILKTFSIWFFFGKKLEFQSISLKVAMLL